jgi:hypothetical protein
MLIGSRLSTRLIRPSSSHVIITSRQLPARIGQTMSSSTLALEPGKETGVSLRPTQLVIRHPSPSSLNPCVPSQPPSVLFETQGTTRTYKLNRPKALNSLDPSIVWPLADKIKEWKEDPECKVVLGVGDSRAFCAGGDVKGESAGLPSSHLPFLLLLSRSIARYIANPILSLSLRPVNQPSP